MSIEAKLNAVVRDIASGQVFADYMPEDISNNLITPVVVYTMISGPTDKTQTSFVRNPRYRFDIFGSSKPQVIAVQEELIKAIDHRPGIGISAVFDGEEDISEPESRLYHRMVDFLIWDQEN
jgi:hypothetical protein